MDLRRQLLIIRRWFPVFVAGVLFAAGGALVLSLQLARTYEAKATLIVGQSLSATNPDYTQLLVSQRLSTTYAAVATTRPVLEAVINALGLGVSTDELAKRVRAVAPSDSTLLTITAQDTDPSTAAAVANAIADQLIAASSTIQGGQPDIEATIDAQLKATQEQIDSAQAEVERITALSSPDAVSAATLQALEGRLTTLRSTYVSLLAWSAGGASRMSVIEPAVAPVSPVSPNVLLNTVVAAALGLLLAAGVVFVAEYVDDTVKDGGGVEEIAALGTLGTIVQMRGDHGRSERYRLVTLLEPRSAVAEAYRMLRTNVEFASVDTPIGTLLVTSSVPGEGKTVTAANLAVVFAQAGRRVLLVDADLRKPGLHTIFDIPNTNGLTTLLRSEDWDPESVIREVEQQNLAVLTTGPLPPNPAELLGSQRMRAVVERLSTHVDLLIFDSPPLQAVADAAVLSSFLDATVFVIRAGHTHRGAIRQGREALGKAGGRLLGAVLSRVPAQVGSDYTDYYRGYYGTDTTDRRVPKSGRSTAGSGS